MDVNNNVYVQILGVEPYLDADDMEKRRTPFERRFNIDRFIFEAPFTSSGKAHSDDIREQQKKKTILRTELPFPYVIKRLKVIEKTEKVLSPIQTSTELIEGRCRLLQNELNQHPPNSKTLQIVLQGSVLLRTSEVCGALAVLLNGASVCFLPRSTLTNCRGERRAIRDLLHIPQRSRQLSRRRH